MYTRCKESWKKSVHHWKQWFRLIMIYFQFRDTIRSALSDTYDNDFIKKTTRFGTNCFIVWLCVSLFCMFVMLFKTYRLLVAWIPGSRPGGSGSIPIIGNLFLDFHLLVSFLLYIHFVRSTEKSKGNLSSSQRKESRGQRLISCTLTWIYEIVKTVQFPKKGINPSARISS